VFFIFRKEVKAKTLFLASPLYNIDKNTKWHVKEIAEVCVRAMQRNSGTTPCSVCIVQKNSVYLVGHSPSLCLINCLHFVVNFLSRNKRSSREHSNTVEQQKAKVYIKKIQILLYVLITVALTFPSFLETAGSGNSLFTAALVKINK
jgi:hypothetical protein